MTTTSDLLARYLRQRRELGETELVLESATVARLLELPGLSASPVAGAAGAGKSGKPGPAPTHTARASSRPAAAPAAGSKPLPVLASGPLEPLRTEALACTSCGLARTRTTVVFGEGNPAADLVVVGEAPGADEDRSGRPFVGRAGKLLDTLLQSIGYPRESVYICNVLKCRPPGNRNPLPPEVDACSPFLLGQLRTVGPRAILAVGTFPAQTLLRTTAPIGQLRGSVHAYEGIPLVPTYHPAALLRNPGWIRPVWDDLQRLRGILDS